jgi:hypothetical protein
MLSDTTENYVLMLKQKENADLPNVVVLLHLILKFFSLTIDHKIQKQQYLLYFQSPYHLLYKTTELTVSSSRSSSSSGTCGGLKKLKKLSQLSVFVMGLAFLDPFLGFFFRIFCVKLFPGCHSISVLENTPA